MKIVALSAGRRNANCEIFAIEALNAAKELGAEVELIRMLDLEVHSCAVCWPCPVIMKGAEHCIYKDDAAWLYNKLFDADGFLLAAPCYSLTPPGQLIAIRDRIMGPRVDIACNWKMKQMVKNDLTDRFGDMEIDERIFRRKVGAMISVGGATTEHWVSLCLASMQTLMFPAQFNVCDQMNVTGVAEDGAATLFPELLEQARQLGRNMVKSFETEVPYELNDAIDHKFPYFGPEGYCPMCHQNLMLFYPDSDKCSCAICGIDGTVSVEDGKVKFSFTEEAMSHSRHLFQGLKDHDDEVFEVSKSIKDKIPQLPENRKAYKPLEKEFLQKPPSKQPKQA